jgi:acyl carrier protein
MTKEIIVQTIHDFLEEEFEVNPDRLIPSANLKAALELDSLDYVDLVVALEKNLHIKIDSSDLLNIHTLQNLYDYVILKMENVD